MFRIKRSQGDNVKLKREHLSPLLASQGVMQVLLDRPIKPVDCDCAVAPSNLQRQTIAEGNTTAIMSPWGEEC